jgi:G8 domain
MQLGAQCLSVDQFRDGFEQSAPSASHAPGLITPPSGNLTQTTTVPLVLSGALTATLTATQNGGWQEPATWGGRLPSASDIVAIPRGKTVQLSGAVPVLQGLHIDGELRGGASDFQLRSKWILVSGKFQVGAENTPYTANGLIELHGTDGTQNILQMGTKNIAVSNGGLLKLHGQCRLAWTKLSAEAMPGSTQIQLVDAATSWRSGDQIVLVSSSYDPRQAEVLTISSVNNNTVSFTPALQYRHVALVQSYDGKTLDQRAAVGLLSRNLKIAGAADSTANAFGGHVMSMSGAHMQVSGVEFIRMGQAGRLGRYPIHWHQAGDRSGNYFIANSIRDSFQRAAVLHSTHNVWFDSNVAYNISNHAFVWSEDGDEYGNTLSRNLGILVRSPEPANFAFPINNPFHGNTSQDEHRSSVFWGRSFDRMTITGNISAGVLDGFGFFFDLFSPAPFGDDEGAGLIFRDNISHSSYKSFATGNQINYPEATTGHALMVSTGSSGNHDHVFERYTGFYNASGAWFEDRSMSLKNSILADNGVGLLLLRAKADGVTIVGDSANPIPIEPFSPSVSFGETAGIQVAGSNHGGKRAPIIRNSTIINQSGYGVLYDLDNVSPAAEVSDVRFINTPKRFAMQQAIHFEFGEPPSFGLTDSTGALFGLSASAPSRALRYDSPAISASCQEYAQTNAYRCAQNTTLLLDAELEMDLADTLGRVIFARYFGYFDAGMPEQGAVSYLANGSIYEVATTARSNYRFKLSDATQKSVEMIFAADQAPSLVQVNGQGLSLAASLQALRAANNSGYFFNASRNDLHLRVVATQADNSILMNASFLTRGLRGRAPIALPANAVDGIKHQVFAANASYRLRQPIASGSPIRSGVSVGTRLDDNTSVAVLSPSVNGDAAVFSGYVYAPSDGIYRVALWGDGGGTATYIGDTWVSGEPWSFINSNWVTNNALTNQVVAFQVNSQVALSAGWHPITVVHAKFPQHNGFRVAHLRWAPPNAPDTWVYPSWKQAP